MPETPRAQLIHIDVDRRLGHEWDEWDGRPLPNRGDYDSSPALFFVWSAAALAAAFAIARARASSCWLPVSPLLHPARPHGALDRRSASPRSCSASGGPCSSSPMRAGAALLPERLAERGPFLRLMRLTSRVADRFGRRDWVENAAVKVYNALALLRGRKVGKGEMLLLIPRCLSKETLDGVLGIAGKYGVPVFVATRGQLARRVIRERRPRAVVAVACERDMVSGLHDVAGKVPGARPHDDAAVGTLQGRAARPGAAGGVGEGVRGVSGVKPEANAKGTMPGMVPFPPLSVTLSSGRSSSAGAGRSGAARPGPSRRGGPP